jgi:CRISPR-associated endonuclease/helicase Cas3
MSNVLLAKSDPQVTLEQHTQDVLNALDNFLRVGFPKTPPQYWALLRAAIVFHDLGKAHSEFQKVLQPKEFPTNEWKWQRHELLSMPYVQALQGFSTDEKLLIERIVAGHHKTFDTLSKKIGEAYSNGEFPNEFAKINHEGVLEIIKNLGKQYVLGEIKPVLLKDFVIDYQDECDDNQVKNRHDLLLLVGAFKHCDHLASAFVDRIEFLENDDFKFIKEDNPNLYKHQEEAEITEGGVILTAPTGSGKTETAMLWLNKQLAVKKQGRTFYILPFTASINAMYQRLKNENKGFGESKVGMLHGNLRAVIYQQNYHEEESIEDLRDKINDLQESFRNLTKPLKIITPFQLLKHLYMLRGYEKGIFEMTGGYFIFDEIHAYNTSTLAQIMALLRYSVQKLNVTPLIMTATMPTTLRKLIIREIGEYTSIEANEKLYKEFRRHQVKVIKGELIDNLEHIKTALKSENSKGELQKVLVVCNTVARAQEVFQILNPDKNTEGLLLHGGFNGEDRAKKEAILKEKEPRLLVGTQAIEVSLDIDYDVIFTELAPLDALLQRFGRVNRRRKQSPRPCYVFETRNPKDKFIYSESDVIDRTLAALEEILETNEGIVDEKELQRFIDDVYNKEHWEKQKAEFERIYSALKIQTNALFPLRESKTTEDEFYKLFDGIKVLPDNCYPEYKRRLLKLDFIGAELLKVSIRKQTFKWWLREQYIKEGFVFVELPNKKELKIEFWLLKRQYDKDLGLLRDLKAESRNYEDEAFG